MSTTSIDAELAAWLMSVRADQTACDADRLADLWLANCDAKAIKDPKSPAAAEAHAKIDGILNQIVGLLVYARIVHHWDDSTATSMEVGSDEAAHPDLLDELVARVLVMWRECVGEPAEADDEV
jgi:hypothetical protein